MWATLALMSALSVTPAQAGKLELKNVRVTYGILGQERKDTTYLPGDMVVLAFDVEGLQVDAQGQIKYSMGVELTNKKKESLFKKNPAPMTVINSLGGSRLPSFALTEIGADTEPGEYTMTVEINDLAAKTSTKLERKFEVVKPQLGIVRPGFVYVGTNEKDAGAAPQLAPPIAVPGQSMVVNFAVVGFDLKGDKQNPDLSVSMEIQDDSGKAVLEKPAGGKATEIDDLSRKLKVIPFWMPIQVNRSGNFKVVLTAKDNHSGKTVKLPLDLKVLEVK
jgi:hypothetical protein